MKLKLPDFKYETKLWRRGYKYIGGVDEVGRGSFAGPLVAGCVVFRKNQEINVAINDSKKLTQKMREKANEWIKNNALAYGIGRASVSEINKFGITKATNLAFRRSITDCQNNAGLKIDYLLIDAFYVPYVKGLRRKNQMPVVKGDTKSISIAAASIIAKVYRDALMARLSRNPKYKKYKWDKNKGYGTKEHRKAIDRYGKSRLHRVSFLLEFD